LIRRHTIFWTPVWLVLAMTAVLAQNGEDVGDDQPLPETEIICFAAKKQWVCAPADEQDKAHQKAMQLAQQPDQPETFNDGQVAIQTMDVSNDFSQQVQETPVLDPNSIEAQIQDFIPRQEADGQAENAVVDETAASPSTVKVNTTPTSVAAEPSPVEPEPTVTLAQTNPPQIEHRDALLQDPVAPVSAPVDRTTTQSGAVPNDFQVWQRQHAEQWAFQVVGTSNRHHIDDFVRTSGISHMPHAVVRTQVNGADWWVVLVGLFDSREQALSQRQTLPAALSGNAWVRQIKSIVGQAD